MDLNIKQVLEEVKATYSEDELKKMDIEYPKSEIEEEFPDGMSYDVEKGLLETEYPNENELPLDDSEELMRITLQEKDCE
jgi:hypothetical protein